MLNHKTILAIFKDADDETLCTPLLEGIPGLIRAMAGSSLAITLDNLKRIGIEPSLTVFTGRLYPGERPDLVAMLRRSFPATEFLLVSSAVDPVPPLQQLAADRVRHLAINPAGVPHGAERDAKGRFHAAVTKLVEGLPWAMADYVNQDTAIHEFAVSASAEKEELIRRVEAAVRGDAPEIDSFRQRGALLADEMLENALYGAPRGEDGGKLYRKGEQRAIRPAENIVFRFGFDGETLAMEVADGWGSLSPDHVLEHLARDQEKAGWCDDTGGRGLFIIWRFLDQFHVSISPGRQTVVGGHLRVSSPLDLEAPKGFHISTHP